MYQQIHKHQVQHCSSNGSPYCRTAKTYLLHQCHICYIDPMYKIVRLSPQLFQHAGIVPRGQCNQWASFVFTAICSAASPQRIPMMVPKAIFQQRLSNPLVDKVRYAML